MEVRPGYKKTEVGVIPAEWGMKPFRDLFTFQNGVNADKAAYGQGTRFINVLEPITYSHIHGPEITGRVTLPESIVASYAVKHGDVLFNRTSETDNEIGLAGTYVGAERVVFGGFVIRGRPTGEDFDPLYSGYALRAPIVRSQVIPMAQGAIRANIGQTNLKRVLAPIPPLPEQRAIAAALSDVDALLGGLDRLIAKKRDLKQAAMQQLLTGQIRLPGFSGAWEVKRLDELGKCFAGGTPSTTRPDYWGGDVFWLPSGRIQNSTLGAPSDSEITITQRGLSESAAKLIKPFSALVAITGATCANVALLQFEAAANQSVVAIEPFEEADARFIFYALLMERGQILSRQGGSAQGGVNLKAVKGIEIQCPGHGEQTVIAAVLSDMDAELATLEARRDKTRDLKQAMMQELLTGKTRLVRPEAAHA